MNLALFYLQDRAAAAVLDADMQSDPKKQGKEKKPGFNLVSLVFLEI